jgi:uncharacterized cupin superfamily protein
VAAVINLDDVRARDIRAGDIAFARRRLGSRAGTRAIGLSHYSVPAGARQMPVHSHGDEEEIFFVLGGEGLSWQAGETCAVGSGDVVVHPPSRWPHTFLAGPEGLELLAFASGSETSLTYLPRAQVMFAGPRWVPVDGPHPFEVEAAAGPLEASEPGPRPANVVAVGDLDGGGYPGAEVRRAGQAGGAAKAGLNHVRLDAGAAGAPLHCHALEEELFYVLDGAGELILGEERHPLEPGDVVARPPATGQAHQLVAGSGGLTYLAYGTRVPGDSVFYPERGEVRLRGLGVSFDVNPRQA